MLRPDSFILEELSFDHGHVQQNWFDSTHSLEVPPPSFQISINNDSQHDIIHHPDSSLPVSKPTYPGPLALALLMLGICLAAFLVALDRTIIATAIPRITDDFRSSNDVGWYGSAYLLTSCAFQPTYGRVFAHFDVRWSFLTALAIFEVGSLICGAAPNSVILIVGRAIAGVGCAGIFSGCLIIISLSVPLATRPFYTAIVGSIFGIGSVCGPVLGGAFTDSATWRWCFYINLPIGAVTIVTLIFFFHPGNHAGPAESFVSKILKLDIVGNFLIVTTVIMLLLALEWGGVSHAWNSPTIIGLLVGTGIELVIFTAWQKYRGATALIPLSIVGQRTVASSFAAGFFLSGATLVHAYYIPYWLQAIRGDTATESGVNMIPYVASNFFFVLLTGVVAMKTGYVNPPALLGPIPATIGSGLLTTLSLNSSTAKWAGYQVLAAAGIGMSIQQGVVAVQAVLPEATVPIGTALVIFAQSLSGAIFISAGNNLLRNDLMNGLAAARLPGVDVAAVLAAGSTELRRLVPVEQLVPVLEIYNSALMKVMILAVPLAGLGLVSAVPMEWVSLKGKTVVGGE